MFSLYLRVFFCDYLEGVKYGLRTNVDEKSEFHEVLIIILFQHVPFAFSRRIFLRLKSLTRTYSPNP